jgi:hypothetical protein
VLGYSCTYLVFPPQFKHLKGKAMNKVLDILNNKWLVAIVVGLFLLSIVRSFAGRKAA